MKNIGLIIVVLILVIVILVFINKKLKRLKIDNVYFITGGVKTGKTALSVYLAIKTHLKNLLKWYLTHWLFVLFKKDHPKPMLYSNIPLRFVRFNPLTMDIIKRKVRIPPKSIVLIDEVSLLADSMLFKDKKINNYLLCFIKLYGHYSHGGYLIMNSQSISDCHFAVKRCLSHYLYINNKVKLPFITRMNVRELIYSDDGSATLQNNFSGDIEKCMLNVYFLNFIYKCYDYCCYSVFTDCLPYQTDYKCRVLGRRDSLKADVLISFQDFDTLDRRKYVKQLERVKKMNEKRKNTNENKQSA